MRELIEYPLESGGSILVEVDLADDQRIVRAARSDELAAKASQTFEHALDRVRPVADAVLTRLKGLASRPDEVEVSFGLKLSTEAGAILASAGAEANLQVKLKWVRGEHPETETEPAPGAGGAGSRG